MTKVIGDPLFASREEQQRTGAMLHKSRAGSIHSFSPVQKKPLNATLEHMIRN
jgi:hypothetical protein